jgi:hypothetical protein
MDVSRGGWHDVAQQNVVLHVPQLSPFFYAINLKLLRARPSFMLLWKISATSWPFSSSHATASSTPCHYLPICRCGWLWLRRQWALSYISTSPCTPLPPLYPSSFGAPVPQDKQDLPGWTPPWVTAQRMCFYGAAASCLICAWPDLASYLPNLSLGCGICVSCWSHTLTPCLHHLCMSHGLCSRTALAGASSLYMTRWSTWQHGTPLSGMMTMLCHHDGTLGTIVLVLGFWPRQ